MQCFYHVENSLEFHLSTNPDVLSHPVPDQRVQVARYMRTNFCAIFHGEIV